MTSVGSTSSISSLSQVYQNRFANVQSSSEEATALLKAHSTRVEPSNEAKIAMLSSRFGEELVATSTDEDGILNEELLRENIQASGDDFRMHSHEHPDGNVAIPEELLLAFSDKFGEDVINSAKNEDGEITHDALKIMLEEQGIVGKIEHSMLGNDGLVPETLLDNLIEKFGEDVISLAKNEDGNITHSSLKASLEEQGIDFEFKSRGHHNGSEIVSETRLNDLIESFGEELINSAKNEDGEITHDALKEVLKESGEGFKTANTRNGAYSINNMAVNNHSGYGAMPRGMFLNVSA